MIMIVAGWVANAIGGSIKSEWMLHLGASMLFVGGLLLGVHAGLIKNRYVDEPITPTININCTDNVCDTTYVYKFRDDE